MLITTDNTQGRKIKILDASGKIIPYVTSFDTETQEIELCIPVGQKNGNFIHRKSEAGEMETAKVKFKVTGARAVDFDTDEEIK